MGEEQQKKPSEDAPVNLFERFLGPQKSTSHPSAPLTNPFGPWTHPQAAKPQDSQPAAANPFAAPWGTLAVPNFGATAGAAVSSGGQATNFAFSCAAPPPKDPATAEPFKFPEAKGMTPGTGAGSQARRKAATKATHNGFVKPGSYPRLYLCI